MLAHSCIAATQTGLVLGLLHHEYFTRKQRKNTTETHEQRKRKPIEEKERLHYILKSGCKIEEKQVRSYEKLSCLTLLYSVIALLYTLKDMLLDLATLGGRRPAPSDEMPGVSSIWKGLEKFFILLEYKKFICE